MDPIKCFFCKKSAVLKEESLYFCPDCYLKRVFSCDKCKGIGFWLHNLPVPKTPEHEKCKHVKYQ